MKKWWFVVAALTLFGSILIKSGPLMLGIICIYGALRIAEIIMEEK